MNITETLFLRNGTEATDIKNIIKFNEKLGTGDARVTVTCGRCGGAGSHISYGWACYDGGKCFDCRGSGRMTYIRKVFTGERLAALNAKAEAKAAEAKAKADAIRDEFYEENSNLIAAMVDLKETNENIESLLSTYERDGTLSKKACDYAASLIMMEWNKVYEASMKVESTHLGTEGERLDITATVKYVKMLDGFYGVSALVAMIDDEGRELVYIGTKREFYEVESGSRITFKATVKKHDVYKGTKNTKLSRPTAPVLV
jgi:hypothetical protein